MLLKTLYFMVMIVAIYVIGTVIYALSSPAVTAILRALE